MFLKAVQFLLVLLEVLFFFNLLIVVHELGAVIEEFGILFGPPIWRRKFNGVWYSFGSIPLGGFVKLPQLGNASIEGKSEFVYEYDQKPDFEGNPEYVHDEVEFNEKTMKWERKGKIPTLKP